jgi:beta-glucosidase
VIEAVVDANPNTIFMLETGNPVAMPWRDKVRAIIEWNPGRLEPAPRSSRAP